MRESNVCHFSYYFFRIFYSSVFFLVFHQNCVSGFGEILKIIKSFGIKFSKNRSSSGQSVKPTRVHHSDFLNFSTGRSEVENHKSISFL